MNQLLRFAAPVVIAVVLGPLIPGLALAAFVTVANLFDQSGSLGDAATMGIFYLIFAYVIGGPIALLGGLLVSVWMIWRPPSAIVVIAAAVVATALWLGVGALGALGPVLYTNAHANFLFILSFAIVAAIGCWLLTRWLARIA